MVQGASEQLVGGDDAGDGGGGTASQSATEGYLVGAGEADGRRGLAGLLAGEPEGPRNKVVRAGGELVASEAAYLEARRPVSTRTVFQMSRAMPRQSKPGPMLALVAGAWTVTLWGMWFLRLVERVTLTLALSHDGRGDWIPAFAGMTVWGCDGLFSEYGGLESGCRRPLYTPLKVESDIIEWLKT